MISLLGNFLDLVPWSEVITLLVGIGLIYLRRAYKNLTEVKQQVTKNGGSSLLDAVNRTENTVLKLAANNEALMQISSKAMFKTDEFGNCVWVNGAYSQYTGKSLEELKGHGWGTVIAREDKDKVISEWNLAVQDTRRFDLEFSVVNKVSLKKHKVKCKAYPLIIKGTLHGYLGSWTILETQDVFM